MSKPFLEALMLKYLESFPPLIVSPNSLNPTEGNYRGFTVFGLNWRLFCLIRVYSDNKQNEKKNLFGGYSRFMNLFRH